MVRAERPVGRRHRGGTGKRPMKILLFMLGVVAAPLAVVVILVPPVLLVFVGMTTCKPPSAAQLDRQRAFVLAHLPDARIVEVEHRDCDDEGRGYVEFSTPLEPTSAAARFLGDSACTAASDTLGSEAAVTCRSDQLVVFISFDASKAGSDAVLDMPPL